MLKVHFRREVLNFEDSGRLEAPGNSISGTGAHPESLSATRSPSFHSENWIFPFKKKKMTQVRRGFSEPFQPVRRCFGCDFPTILIFSERKGCFLTVFQVEILTLAAKVQPSREPPGAPVPVSGRGHETRVPRPRKQVNYWTWSLNKVKV